MKILYVTTLSPYYNSPATIRNINLIKGFIKLGYKVDVLTIKEDPNSMAYDPKVFDIPNVNIFKLTRSKTYESFTYKSAPKRETFINKLIKRIKKIIKKVYLRFQVFDGLKSSISLKNVCLNLKKYDVVISSSDPKSSHLLARNVITKYKLKSRWIQYWGDPMYLDSTNKSIFKKRLKYNENKLLSKADKIIYVSPLTLSAQKRVFNNHSSKMFFLPPSYDKFIEYEQNGEYFSIGYFGSYFLRARNIIPLYNSLKNLNYESYIVGNGDVSIKTTKSTTVISRVNYDELLKFEAEVDLLICLCNSSGTQIPSKVYNYIATNKPILIILDGNSEELYNYFSKYNRFYFSNNNELDITKKINEIKKEYKSKNYSKISFLSNKNIACKFLSNIRKEK